MESLEVVTCSHVFSPRSESPTMKSLKPLSLPGSEIFFMLFVLIDQLHFIKNIIVSAQREFVSTSFWFGDLYFTHQKYPFFPRLVLL